MCLLRVWIAVCGRTMFPDHEVSTSQCQVPRMVGAECWRPVTENKGFPGKGLLYWLALKKKKKKQTHMHTDTQSLSKGCTMSLGQSYIYKLIYKFKHQSPETAQWGKVPSATLMT